MPLRNNTAAQKGANIMAIYNNVTELIGKTPILKLNNFSKSEGVAANIFAKLEYFNPAGSVKDRIAYAMISDAEAKGELKPSATIIEPTSGNTGIGLASVGTAKGYKVILTMPETMSVERRNLVKAYGAEVVLTEGAKGMKGAIEKANELKELPALLSWANSLTPQTPRLTMKPPARKFGQTPKEKLMLSLQASAPAAPFPELANILKIKIQMLKFLQLSRKHRLF